MSGTLLAPLWNIGPRISAQVLGIPYDQYRTSGAVNPTDVSHKIGNIPAWITADAKGMGTGAFRPEKPTAFIMVDPDVVAVGDYLIGQFGTFFVTSMDGVMPMQCVRCNQTVTVSRPGAASPGAGYYGGVQSATNTPLMTAFPASVIQGTKGERGELVVPGDVRQAWVAILLPAPAGVEILPGDWIVTQEATPMTYTVSGRELTPLGWRISAATAVA